MRPRGWRVYLRCWVARHVLWSSVSTRLLRHRMSTDLSLRQTSSVPSGHRTVCLSVRFQRRELYQHLFTRLVGTWLQPGNGKAMLLSELILWNCNFVIYITRSFSRNCFSFSYITNTMHLHCESKNYQRYYSFITLANVLTKRDRVHHLVNWN